MHLIHNISKAFHNLCSYDTENLIHAIQSLNISLHKISPFITSPVNHEYGRNVIYQSEFVEILVLNFSSKAKTFVHDHGISLGCILIVDGTLQNITYENNSERIEEFSEGNIFTVKKDTVHKMYNATDSTAITFHVYSPPLKDVQIYE
ncbi:cysteine dioxygenase [Bacillus toyonensis]|uniref:cysteine dioxygenase n=1 Tax=Bacillus toyonensis TaxID=155322 RepID=UPI0018A1697B|nr:cysteine dioxygenase family protein [Bacillus toyonensis]MBF7149145.1 cysteine dioxygenase family protein [Bacillus toyonensis]MEC2349172.1 cysteine dioxygenase family protein [Bacillus toyonensis]MED3188257.1 cysteine dioxygenase family protein [Bacillus toyonensis]